ncbi:glycoside hydrolase [Mobilicoccus caccae]|uniref:Glycoside hydrolase n=1 Tax=Mobilicoccus caccae TaxID=1859295 RepID=A0ABQ6IWI2_9MICO|nr:glycoside hydrolase [Mobilicoccus caccae]
MSAQATAVSAAVPAQATAAQRSTAISSARAQLGTPYRWGGTSPSGFDCSGLVQYAFGKAGKDLPRTAAAQYAATQRTSSPRPGDIVFFGGAGAHHNGIYLGNGKMIHSPRSGKSVEITNVWKGASYGKVR